MSSDGRVRVGPGGGFFAEHVLTPRKTNDHWEYPRVDLSRYGPRKTLVVHRLVAEAFLGPCPEGYEVNHRNGDKMDNRAENLEYVTHADNIRHGRRVLGKQRGEGNHRAKLTEELVLKIRSEYEPYVMGYRKLGHRYGICFTHVRSIVKGRVWSHVQALKAAKP